MEQPYQHIFRIKESLLPVIVAILLVSCSKNAPDNGGGTGGGGGTVNNQITAFSVTKPDGTALEPSEYSVAILQDSVKVVIPPLVYQNGLKATVATNGSTVSPASGSVVDFTNPVNYTVTASNGSTKNYKVEVNYAKPRNIVFVGAGNNFYAIDAVTGAQVWKYAGTGSFAYSSATYQKNVVYVGSIDSYVYAFNASNGRLLWRFLAGNTGVESDAVIADSTVYVGSNDDKLYAINAITGQERWSFTTGSNVSSSPKISNGVVYFGSSDGKFYALNATTGQLIWQYQTGGMINQSGACLSNGVLYFGSRDGYLHAINASNGSLRWKFGTGIISFEQSSPTISNGVVYIGGWYQMGNNSVKGSLYAVDAATGNLVWERLPNTGFSSSPFVSNGRVMITGDDLKISVLETATGNTLWQKTILANSASPVEANGIIYVGGGGTGYIYALNPQTGAEVWKFPIASSLMTSSPIVIDISGSAEYPGDSGGED